MARVRVTGERVSMQRGGAIEPLEPRTMLCAFHLAQSKVREILPALLRAPVKPSTPRLQTVTQPEPAHIIWTNRAATTTGGIDDTDKFGATFGASAPLARAVVDAVIFSYERMIGSFNYTVAGQKYELKLTMAGNGFGASADLTTSLGGKPQAGTINLGRGNNSAAADDDNGWFIDPTPLDNSEFLGTIVNAFSADAPSGSPALNKADFFTIIAAEMTHCLGLFGNALPAWTALTTNTGAADTVATPGNLWVFRGPSIKHLMTSDNAGSSDTNSAIHSSEPGNTVTFDGDTYIGAQDHGNAFFEFGRRYLVNNVFALMFRDAYGFSTVDPAKFGTMHSTLNHTTRALAVRGTGGADIVSITRTGDTIAVSVDPKTDAPGTGALPGAGDLPAFVSYYDISELASININTGGDNDVIIVGANIGIAVKLDAGAGSDVLTLTGTKLDDVLTINAGTIGGAVSVASYVGFERMIVAADAGENLINFNGAALPIASDLGGGGAKVSVNVNSGSLVFHSTQHLIALNVAANASASLVIGGNKFLALRALDIHAQGSVALNDNDLLLDYDGESPGGMVRALIARARTPKSAGKGLSSIAPSAVTTLAAIEATDYKSIHGQLAKFNDTDIDDSAVLIKYTYFGDADFNGRVNFDDYARIDQGFNSGSVGWINGDFSGDGRINFDDYSLIDLAFNSQGIVL